MTLSRGLDGVHSNTARLARGFSQHMESTMYKMLAAVMLTAALTLPAYAGPEPGHTTGNKAQGYSFGDHGRFMGYVGNGPGALIRSATRMFRRNALGSIPVCLRGRLTLACVTEGDRRRAHLSRRARRKLQIPGAPRGDRGLPPTSTG